MPNCDFKYRIFNADGGEVAQCGNGARCFARFVKDKGLTNKDEIAVQTQSGVIYPALQSDSDVKVDMGLPRFLPETIPFEANEILISYPLELKDNQSVDIGVVSMGNPHAVIVVENSELADVDTIGPQVESHPRFPERVNVGFMDVLSPEHIKLRVYERGAGETQACGTGACAAVVSGIKRGLLARNVTVSLLGGDLSIAWPDDNSSVWMTGPTTHVFDGEISWATINSV
jgi:diaminopimelate epimerase